MSDEELHSAYKMAVEKLQEEITETFSQYITIGSGCHLKNECIGIAASTKFSMRTMTEFCIAADNVKGNRYELKNLLSELHLCQERYSGRDFEFIKEHIEGYIEQLNNDNSRIRAMKSFED